MIPGWLTSETAEFKASELIDQIREEIKSMNRGVTTSLQEEAKNAVQSRYDRSTILNDWFESSIGLLDGSDQETWYVTEAPVGSQYAGLGIIRWTSWIGDVVTRVRNAILDGTYPTDLLYGSPGKEFVQRIGPLVEYVIRSGKIHHCDFKFDGQLGADIQELDNQLAPTEPQYGLRTRIRTLDLAQNEQIRGPVNGTYILTGGPGTGKTTVALHRIPFLIDAHADPQVTIPSGTPRVTEENTLVVVWEPHLAPYLQTCLDALGLTQIPRANVVEIQHWLSTQLRAHVPFSPYAYRRIMQEPAHAAKIKGILTEDMLKDFLESRPSLAGGLNAELGRFVDEVRGLQDEIAEKLGNFRATRIDSDGPSSQITYRNVLGRVGSLMTELENSKFKNNQVSHLLGRLKSLQSTIRGGRIVAVLRAFYHSEDVAKIVSDSFGQEQVPAFQELIRQQTRDYALSDADRFLLLWLIDLPEASDLLEQRIERLPHYAHIMIDEAQYYEPIVLRLLARLCDVPNGTMTIVGDLEQRVTSTGGLIEWQSAGLSVSEENIHRLEINYRWSEPIFEFLDVFQNVSGIESPLTRPKRWFSRNGRTPQVHTFTNCEDELACVVDEIAKFRHSTEGNLGTVAVVVPESYQNKVQSILIDPLNDYAIDAMWAVGDQVRDSVHKVIVTKYNNVVGLEFNAVFVVGVNEVLEKFSKEEIQAVWVALSRAHQLLFVSKVGQVSLFDRPEFERYRQDPLMKS